VVCLVRKTSVAPGSQPSADSVYRLTDWKRHMRVVESAPFGELTIYVTANVARAWVIHRVSDVFGSAHTEIGA
jgi:hypothetical protein